MADGRVAIVTGGAKGIGRASALRLAADGRAIVIWDVAESEAVATAERVRDNGATAEVERVDLRDRAAIETAFARAMAAFGHVDILVNAAGIIGTDASVLTTPMDEWDDVLAVNLSGTYLSCRAAVGHMAERGWGRIVNFTSQAALGVPALVPYAVSKAGVTALTRSFAKEFSGRGVLINAVEPGRTTTDMVLSRVPAEVVEHPPGVPMGRYAEPEEIAEVVAFLCSERNTYMSGAVVPVRGGG